MIEQEQTTRERKWKELVWRSAILIIVLYLLYYIGWRIVATLNPDALIVSLLLLAAEAWGVLNLLFFAFMTWNIRVRPRFELREGLKVDVYVTTYDEPLEVLEATLTGCQRIRYPHTTYVLDDGRRPEVEALASRLGCRYLTRPDNRHGKAGNINAALPRTDGELIAFLDADMIPQPDFLHQTLGYFIDDRVALVQCPQEFYNFDSLQHVATGNGSLPWHEQSLFFRVIQPGKNRWNAAFWCGSPSVVRRVALESVGGVAHSITEDILTSLRLHAQGWRTVYHDQVVAYGIAPQTYRAFMLQRLRWAQGALRILRSRENPLIVPGLTIAQRLNYLGSMLTYFDGFQKLVFLVVPLGMIWFGWMPIRSNGLVFILHWLAYFFGCYLAAWLLGRGWFRIVWVEHYNILKMLIYIRAALVVIFPVRLRFRVTPKSFANDVWTERRALLRLIVLGVTMTFSSLLGLVSLLGLPSPLAAHSSSLLAIGTFWSALNGMALGMTLARVLRRRYRRVSYRFPVALPARLEIPGAGIFPCLVSDLSRDGAGVLFPQVLEPVSTDVHLELLNARLSLWGRLIYARADRNGSSRVGIQFYHDGQDKVRVLLELLFVDLVAQQRAGTLARLPLPTAQARP